MHIDRQMEKLCLLDPVAYNSSGIDGMCQESSVESGNCCVKVKYICMRAARCPPSVMEKRGKKKTCMEPSVVTT